MQSANAQSPMVLYRIGTRSPLTGRSRAGVWGPHSECEPMAGVCGRAMQRGPEAEPGGQGSEGETLLWSWTPWPIQWESVNSFWNMFSLQNKKNRRTFGVHGLLAFTAPWIPGISMP